MELPDKIKHRKTKLGFSPPEVDWLEEADKELYIFFSNKDFYAGELEKKICVSSVKAHEYK